MNYMNTTDLKAREPLNNNAVVSRILLQDEGEIIIIEGKHVAVDKNSNRINKSFDSVSYTHLTLPTIYSV